MSSQLPTICILATDARERVEIATSLEDAGFVVFAAADAAEARQTLRDTQCRAMVVALAEADTRDVIEVVQAEHGDIPVVLVTEPHHAPIEHDGVLAVRRPLLPHELIGAALDQILREGPDGAVAHHGCLAEFALAAAELACLCRRQAAAVGEDAAHLVPFRRIADLQAALGID